MNNDPFTFTFDVDSSACKYPETKPIGREYFKLTTEEMRAIEWAIHEASSRSKVWTAGDQLGLGRGMIAAEVADTLNKLLSRIKVISSEKNK